MPGHEASEKSGHDAPAESSEDSLRRLERRLDRASETAERLIAEAAQRAGRKPPPAGWQEVKPDGASQGEPGSPGAERAGGDSLLGAEVDLLLGLLGSVRDLIPPELQRRLADAVREVLLALRALIDWYLERSEHRRRKPPEVQDIPIL